MRFADPIGILLTLALCTYCVDAQQAYAPVHPRVSIPETEVRHIQSLIVGDEFEISVALPGNYQSTDTTYPVMYVTDANVWFAASTQIMRFLQLPGQGALPQILLVGIGYRTESVSKWRDLRNRDLTPTPLPDAINRLSGGAAKFLRFMREELMPFINKNYRTSRDVGYAGGSYGGLFGLYTLFHEPETFQRYIIISPSIWYDSLVTLRHEADYAITHSDLPARVFMSVGSLEQKADTTAGMINDMRQLADRLQSRRYPNLHLDTMIFDGETHRSGIAPAISRGMRVIYQK